jgi:hypothetical protein
MIAIAVKKSPGLDTPLFIAYRGKKVVMAPQMKWLEKPIIDGGRAFQLRRKPSSAEESSSGATCLFPNLLVMNREHNERPTQTQKRMVKLKWLIRNIPKEGARAKEILGASKK